MTDLLESAVAGLFADISTVGAQRAVEAEGWSTEVWHAVADAGLPWVSLPEESGGSGGSMLDAYQLLHIAGRHAVPAPLAETGPLAGWLRVAAGLPISHKPETVPACLPEDKLRLHRGPGCWRITGSLHRVPWARRVHTIVAVAEHQGQAHAVAVPIAATDLHPGINLAGEPRDTLTLKEVTLADNQIGVLPRDVNIEALRRRAAMCRTQLMAGALTRVTEMTCEYAGTREQFGRPIARFQAVAQNLSRLAEHTYRADLAARVGAKLAGADTPALTQVAPAKVLCAEASRIVPALAHQVHGAMGMTEEYPLGRWTRRLWSWETEYGSARYWACRLGAIAVENGPDRLWPTITAHAVGISDE